MPLSKVVEMLREMQTTSPKIWTLVTESISFDDNRYDTRAYNVTNV